LYYLIGAFFPVSYGIDFVNKNRLNVFAWAAGCLVLSTFTLLPAIKTESTAMVTGGGLLMFITGALYLVFETEITSKSRSGANTSNANATSRILMGLQTGLIALTVIVTRSSIASLQAKQGLPLGNQVVGWLVLIASVILPFVHRVAPNKHYLHRLVIIFLTFSPSFVLLTISYEGLFYLAFCFTLLAWVRLEHAIQLHSTKPTSDSPSANGVTITSMSSGSVNLHPEQTFRTLALPDLRRALFFLFFLQSAFFSTGNMASVSSFSLDAVYRLIPIFDPFSQGALLLYKIMVPFILICAALGILNRRLGLQSSALFMTVMAISDIMTLSFFWMVKDEGSWLEIGTTISHFVIGSGLCIFVAGLEGVSQALIQGVDVGEQSFEKQVASEGVDVVKGKHVYGNGHANGKAKGAVTRGREGIDERPVIE
jgi:GPI ethanolamine phosphate transferase 1